MGYTDSIIKFLHGKDDEIMFESAVEKNVFTALAQQAIKLVAENTHDAFCDGYEIVCSAYDRILIPIIRPLLHSNEELMKALNEQVKYGTKITVTTEEMDKLMKEIK